jgi:hypothetical protein
MDNATAGSFLTPVLYNLTCSNWNYYDSWTFPLMQGCVSTSTTSGVGWFQITDNAGGGLWSTYYKWLNDAKTIYSMGEKEQKSNYKAVSLTLQAWILETLTEAFGNVPVTEACSVGDGIRYPKFNSQVEAYQTILDNLDSANVLFNPSEGLIYNTNGDMLYCSSNKDADGIKLWRKFANSLRLRALLRVLNVPDLNAKDQLQKMLSDPTTYPVFESNDESAQVYITGIAPQEQPMPRISDLTAARVYSEFFIDQLKKWKDPRLAIWATKTTNNGVKDYYGLQSGYSVLPSISASTMVASKIAVAPMKLQIMSYSEVEFIKAELVQRGVIEGDAKTLYETAVKATMEQWGVTPSAKYFDNEDAAYNGTLERIMQQKFYALFYVDLQQWFEYNRTGYPVVPYGPGIATGDSLPHRFKYPTIVQRTNPNNYQMAKEAMGGDELNTKLIWQK